MKKVIGARLSVLYRNLLGFLYKIVGREIFLENVADAVERETEFITYHYRPKMATSVSTQSDATQASKSMAIVMQGPIVHKDDFTLGTVKIYQRHFVGSRIILSTWETESPSVIRRFEDLGITVILNKKPAYAGISNINLQIHSSRNGMRRAKEIGVEYALKTRSDQRMYAPNVADFLYNVTETFPITGNWPKQRKRIVGCSLNTFKYRMYGLSDMLIYGHIDDMLLYWNIELDERTFDEEQQRQAIVSLRSYARWRVCEVYLATEFLGRVERELKWTLRDSWSAFADHFCVIDKEQLDLFWPKYNHSEYRWLRYNKDTHVRELSFRDWLGVYVGLEAQEIPENILETKLT
jgi:hypothetical protein